MLSSVTPQRYFFDKQGKIKEVDSLSCKTVISPQKYVDTSDNLTCTTHVIPQIYEISKGNFNKMDNTYQMNIGNMAMDTNVYVNHLPTVNNLSALPYAVDEYNKLREVQETAQTPNVFNLSEGTQYYVNSPNGVDPGVVAVSNALFNANSAFQTIPIKNSPNIFRRRRRGEPNSEWSNAFVTRIDPCECVDPEEEYKPYEITKVYDNSGVKTVFNFDNEHVQEEMQNY